VPHRRVKVLIVRPSLAGGGADRITTTLLQSLSRERFELALALNRLEGPFLEDVPSDVPIHELGASSLWTAWLPLRRLLRTTRPDVLFSTCGGMNLPASLASLTSPGKRRLVLSERNVLVRDHPWPKKWSLLLAKGLLYPTADRITAVSQGVKDDLAGRLRLAPGRIRVVYNPVTTPELETLAREQPRHPWLQDGAPVVLAAGRLVPAKGFDLLIRAAAVVRRRHPLRLVILGEGPERPRLLALARELQIADCVDLPGFDKNPFSYMRSCTLFVLSSRYEGLPGVLIQAMACGAPVVATDCPAGPAEIISPGQDGILVPVEDVDALAAEIERLLGDPETRHRLGDSARRSAQRFGRDRVVEAYEQALV
jgi:glycosyltransferase involved in cell wall biosynthesis